MPWGFAIGGVLGLVGAGLSSHAATNAADTQANSANHAADLQMQMYQQTRSDQAPWRQAGANAVGSMSGGFGLGPTSGGIDSGYFNHQFNAGDLGTNLDPSYNFRLSQGLGTATNAANRYGGGGNLIKGVTDYATGMASTGYQQAFNNYTANQTNIYNRLASIAGMGQTAGSNAATGGSTYAANQGAAIVGAGNANASGIVGSANAISGGLTNAANWYALSQMQPGGMGGGPT